MNKTGTRLSAALLGYFILIILLLTLNPFYLVLPEQITFTLDSDFSNLVANILLFLPLGFLHRLTSKRGGALLLGAIVSFGVESIQIFIPARTPSVIDILANTLGAGLGAALHSIISSRMIVTKAAVGRLRLETPLMGAVYLLIPLLWANSLALGYAPDRKVLTLLIGVMGAIIISELFRHWWDHTEHRIIGYASLAAGIWFILGAFLPFRQPGSRLMIGLIVIIATALLTALPKYSKERRFERATLQKVFPVFSLYMILLALWEPLRPLTAWHWSLGFTDQIAETSLQILPPRVEYLVAFTVLGYLSAEWRGRSEIPLRRDLPNLFLNATGVALALEFFAGFQAGPGASIIRAILAIVSALFGGVMYHLLRAHIRFLLNRH